MLQEFPDKKCHRSGLQKRLFIFHIILMMFKVVILQTLVLTRFLLVYDIIFKL